MKFIGKLFKILLLVLLAVFLVGLGYYFAVTKDVRLSAEKLALTEKSVTVYDHENARVITPCLSETKATVVYEQLPTHTIHAFVDTEDKRFFRHHGFDVKRIVKSLLNNVRAGSFKQGASTISQQLIKNTHLSQEKTVKRKLQELKLTRQLEKRYSKEEILEKYLSVIYFGHSCFGLPAAAEFYFGKTPQELDIAESAILAGLVKSPNNYSPFKNAENCQKRKISVLNAMKKNGSITDSEYATAKAQALPVAPTRNEQSVDYVQLVFDELSEIADEEGFTVGGKMEIFTYLDQDAQAILTETAAKHEGSDKNFCILDGKTRGFKACVSSVREIKRLPASLLKPLLVYAPAIEENLLSPATPILDERIRYGNYAPENYDGAFHGYVSAREALAKSLNIPAVKTLESLTVERAARYLEKLRLPVPKADYSLALALGGMQEGYSLYELVSAYSALQNGGIWQPTGFIREIKIDGVRVYHKSEKKERVFSEETAYLTTDMLKTAATTGTAKKLRALSLPVAAKTGTVGTTRGNTDAYAVAYTTQDVVGVWLGNADNRRIDYTGGGLPCNYLLEIYQALQALYETQNQSVPDFVRPQGVVSATLDSTAYQNAHALELADEIAPAKYRFDELFKKDNLPQTRADYFSNPKINPPTITLREDAVVLELDERSPTVYEYKIERQDERGKITLYQGKYIPSFLDENISPDRHYIYTITPIYQDRSGASVTLPTISTGKKTHTAIDDQKVLEKNWWEE